MTCAAETTATDAGTDALEPNPRQVGSEPRNEGVAGSSPAVGSKRLHVVDFALGRPEPHAGGSAGPRPRAAAGSVPGPPRFVSVLTSCSSRITPGTAGA